MAFPFLAALAVLAFSHIRDRALRLKGRGLRPGSVTESGIATATEGKAIPVVFGRVKIASPNLVWWTEDRAPEPIERQDQIVGYKYYMGLQYVLCMGTIDSADLIYFDDKIAASTYVPGSSFDSHIYNLPAHFGEDGGVPDGIVGDVDVYRGNTTSLPNTYLEGKIGANLPAYRNVAYAVVKGMYLGNSPHLRPIAFEVTRYPQMAGSDFQKQIGQDANPANIIYDILTNPIWGCGVDPALIDLATFQQARQWLSETSGEEALGMSFIIDDANSAADVIQDVLRHINGSLYVDPFNGKYRLILIRPDFPFVSVAGAPTFNDSNADEIEITVSSESDIANVIRVHYIDRNANYGARVAQLQDLASIDALGGQRLVEEVDFMGFSTALNAQKAAARELRERAYPLRRCRFKAMREAWTPKTLANPWTPTPGAPFYLDHPNATITLFRVTTIDTGSLTDGSVYIEGIEDVFNVDWIASGAPIDSDWIDPYSVPGPPLAQHIEEPPLNMNYVEDTTKTLCFAVKGPGGQMLGLELINTATNFVYVGVIPESPSGLLVSNITPGSTSFVIGSPNGAMASLLGTIDNEDFRFGLHIALITAAGDSNPLANNELIAYSNITYNTALQQYTIVCVRGCVDTTPRPHSAGQRIWFFRQPFYPALLPITPEAYFPNGTSYTLKMRPIGPGGSTPLADLTTISGTFGIRADRPWMPVSVTLEGLSYPATYTGDLSINWFHRNRWENSYYDNANRSPTQTIEPGVVYRLRFYLNGSGTPTRTVDDLTGTSHTYTAAQQSADNGGSPPATVRVRMDAHFSGSLTTLSYREYDHTVTRV